MKGRLMPAPCKFPTGTTGAFTQSGFQVPEKVFLDKATYDAAMKSIVKSCVDVGFWVRLGGIPHVVIGKRKILPQKDWWVWGGRMTHADEDFHATACRKLGEEIGLSLPKDRLPPEPNFLNYYRWADDGSAVMAPMFVVELSKAEVDQLYANLASSPEYSEIAVVNPTQILAKSDQYHGAVVRLTQHIAALS